MDLISLRFLISAARNGSILACMRICIAFGSPVIVSDAILVTPVVGCYISPIFAGITRDVVFLGGAAVVFMRIAARAFGLR